MKEERSQPAPQKYRNKLEGCWVEGQSKWVMDIKEGTCWDEHWVLYVSESLNSTLKPLLHYVI